MDAPGSLFPNDLNSNTLHTNANSSGPHGFAEESGQTNNFAGSFSGMLAQHVGRNSTPFAPAGTQTHLTSSWQHGGQPSAMQPAQSHLSEPSLGQLLVMYPVVRQLHTSLADANQKISLALEIQSDLVKENMKLIYELREVTARQHLDS